jgi:hypothetical protein
MNEPYWRYRLYPAYKAHRRGGHQVRKRAPRTDLIMPEISALRKSARAASQPIISATSTSSDVQACKQCLSMCKPPSSTSSGQNDKVC